MADADENPEQRAQGQQRGRGEMGRRCTGGQASAEGATGELDARHIVGTASSVGQNEKQTGCSIGMLYSHRAECKVVTGENGRRWRGAALCPSGAARCQTHPIFRQVRARVLADGVIGEIAGMGRWQCWCTQVSLMQWSHVSVAPLWTSSRSVRAFRRLGTWRQSSLHDRMVLHRKHRTYGRPALRG